MMYIRWIKISQNSTQYSIHFFDVQYDVGTLGDILAPTW